MYDHWHREKSRGSPFPAGIAKPGYALWERLSAEFATLQNRYQADLERRELILHYDQFLADATQALQSLHWNKDETGLAIARMANRAFDLYIKAHGLPKIWIDYARRWQDYQHSAKPWEAMRDEFMLTHKAYIGDCAHFAAALSVH